LKAIAGPAIREVRLVHGAKAQKPTPSRPRDALPRESRFAGHKTERKSPREVGGKNGRWVRESQKPSHPWNRRKTAKGSNPMSDTGKSANCPGQVATGLWRARNTGMKRSSGE